MTSQLQTAAGSPVWQLFRVAYRATKEPSEGAALLAGYCWAAARRMKRPVSSELMRFHRREQMKKLRTIFAALLKFRKVAIAAFALVAGNSLMMHCFMVLPTT